MPRQVREKKAEKAAKQAKEREAGEREDRRAREGHAQLVAQAKAQNIISSSKEGPFGEDRNTWQGVNAEGSQEVLLGDAGGL